jgi:hypothetical protein
MSRHAPDQLKPKIREEDRQMKGQTFRVLTAVVVLAAVALGGAIVWAQATKTTLSCLGVVTGGGWDEWREGGNIAHGRGTWYYDVYDESGTTKIGTGYGIMNVNFNMETVNGVQSGSMTFDLTEGGIGTFEGRFTEKMTSSYWEGKVVLHGTGDSAGLKAKGTWGPVHWYNPVRPFQIVILDPHGD